MGLCEFQDVASEFDGRDLHSEAEAEVRNVVLARELGGLDLAFDSAFAEATGNEDAAEAFQMFLRAIALEVLGIDFLDFDSAIVCHPAMNDGFVNGFVGVLKFDVFADDTDANAMLWGDQFANDFLPMRHVRRRIIEAQKIADKVIHPLALEHEGNFVNGVIDVFFFDDCFEWNVTKQGDFLADVFVERLFAATDDDVWRDTNFAQFGDGLLGGFGLELAGGFDEWDVSDVEENGVVVADFEGELANRFEKWQAFNVAGRAADFGDDDVGLGLIGQDVDAIFDFVSDVRNDLDGFAEIFAFAFVVENPLIDLATR